MDQFIIEKSFPTVITSKNTMTLPDFLSAIRAAKTELSDLLLRDGALLFRGFPVQKPDDFASVIEALQLGDFVNYILGDSPRDRVKNKVYTSTEAPPSFRIPLHQELSYIDQFPRNIYFFCEIEPLYHGETTIADARSVTRDLDKEVIKRFQDKQLTYISHYYNKDVIMKLLNRMVRSHKTWAEVFETDDKAAIEEICQKNNIQYQWQDHDWIEIQHTRPAIVQHPKTLETLWFNQAHIFDFNPRMLGLLNFIGSQILYFKRSRRLHEITFADSSPIPRKDLYHIMDVLEKNTVAKPWKQGDVMVLDNILSMHGRAPFKGKRRILTALTKPKSLID